VSECVERELVWGEDCMSWILPWWSERWLIVCIWREN
jgi:hypothetical protein